MSKIPAGVVDQLTSLRAKSHILSQKEDYKLLEIQQIILYRSRIDDEIDRIEKALKIWRKNK